MVIKKKSSSLKTTPIKKKTTEYGDIMDKIKPVKQLDLVLAALFYGRAGTGKTTVACTFPGPILHLDIREKGTDSVTEIENLDTMSLDLWEEFEQVYWYLKSGESGYKTVIIDAVTQLQDLAVEKAMAEDNKTDSIVTKRQWGTASGYLKTWIINYRDLVEEGIHVVFLAHDRVTEGDEGEDGELTPSVGPRLMPSVASILTGGVKITGNTFIREAVKKLEGGKIERKVIYSMRLGPHAFYNTKVRQPKGSYVPDVLDNPDYEAFCQIMKGEFPRPEPKKALPSATKKIIKRRS
jgi:phage nucleotide-binding protein